MSKDFFLVPNIITFSRIFLIPVAIYFLAVKNFNFAFPLILWLFISDFLDGVLARRLNQTSVLGSILDPVADKLVVLFLLGFLTWEEIANWMYLVVVALRHISQLIAVPVLLFWKKIQFKVKPKTLPKIATALNFIILGFYGLFFYLKSSEPSHDFLLELPKIYLLLNTFVIVSIILELQILVTFWPRFIAIYQKKHDTFE